VKPKHFLTLFFNLALALIIAAPVVQYCEADPLITPALTYIGISSLKITSHFIQLLQDLHVGGVAFMAVQTEVWETAIAKNLFKAYEWINRAKNRSSFVIGNKVVHIPQAGSKPGARKNRENFPVPIVKRNDTDVTYTIDEISTEATHIPEADKVELSYNKISDVIDDHFGVLREESARDILDRWYPSLASKMVRTTGTDTAVYLSGQTGNRNKFTVADVESAKTILITDTKRETGPRALIMTEGAYNQLKSDPVVKDKDTMDSVGAVWKEGDLVKIHGFDIIRTDVTGRYDNSGTPVLKDYTADNAATDNDVMLLVDFSFVHYALGTVTFFENLKDATMQGDIYSALVRVGGRKERADEVGVVAIIQEP
jgi:hypothetical protein